MESRQIDGFMKFVNLMDKPKQIESLKSKINELENDLECTIEKRLEMEDNLGDLCFDEEDFQYTLKILKNNLIRLEVN